MVGLPRDVEVIPRVSFFLFFLLLLMMNHLLSLIDNDAVIHQEKLPPKSGPHKKNPCHLYPESVVRKILETPQTFEYNIKVETLICV